MALWRIARAILGRRLQPGTRLPATRDFAQQYNVSRGTVVTAFEQLQAEGYLVGMVGAGTWVNERLPEHLLGRKMAPVQVRKLPGPVPVWAFLALRFRSVPMSLRSRNSPLKFGRVSRGEGCAEPPLRFWQRGTRAGMDRYAKP
ncbi:MAG TPA: winged helix-turn-helix domain-containing protein [Candidatus Acidoferrum sp.]|nr:winged helix-turn-helix domain-containing protein [Candidatus Acidoferrum sp.]